MRGSFLVEVVCVYLVGNFHEKKKKRKERKKKKKERRLN